MLDRTITSSLTEAVRELERCSCAEVVVEIRSRSGSYAHADARFASLLALISLLVLLFSPWTFHPAWVSVDVVVIWMAALYTARKSDSVRRTMTSDRERNAQVHLVASAVFHDRGIANTESETGILVYLSLLERRMELLADRGVLKAVPALEWNQLVDVVRARHATTTTLLATVEALKPILEKHLPVREGDVDELCSVPRFVSE